MNIAIVLEATLGGTRKHVVDLVEHLFREGHEVHLIYALERADDRFKKDIRELKSAGVMCIHLPMTKKVYSPVNFYCIQQLVSLFKAKKIEVVHLHGAVAGALGRTAALFCKGVRKVIYSPHGGVLHKMDKKLSGKIFSFIEKALITKKVSFIAVSADEKEKLKLVLNLPSSKIKLLPNGISVEALQKKMYTPDEVMEARIKLQLEDDDFVLLYPALFLEAKGHLHFFQSFREANTSLHPKVKILLAGHGPLLPQVQSLVNTLPFAKQVHFLGFVTDITKYFQLSDAVLLPSINEAFGYVLLEAMAFGKPIFATNVGGIKDVVVPKKNGFLYDLKNLTAMQQDLNYYSGHRNELAVFGRNSAERVKDKFSLEKTVRQLCKFYEE